MPTSTERVKKFRTKNRKAGLCRCGRKRDNKILKTCKVCQTYEKEWNKKNWATRKIHRSRLHDRDAGRIPLDSVPADFIDKEFLENERKKLQNKCCYCFVIMQTENMLGVDDGLTVERIDNDLPHLKSNCTLACWECNTHRVGTMGPIEWRRK